jgi:hypothetical protein
MADIINLRRARKKKAREDAENKAAENRITFGRSKDERALSEAQQNLSTNKLDGHKRGTQSLADDEPDT